MSRHALLCPQTFLLTSVLLLHACGGGGSTDPRHVPSPPPTIAGSMSGTITHGEQPVDTSALIKGNGPQRRSPSTGSSGKYNATLQRLDPPYMLGSAGQDFVINKMNSVATRGGNVNVTPLTTLISAYAVGQVPDTFFERLGNSNGPDIGVITEEGIARGQRRTIALLADLGVPVPAGIDSFIHDPFDAVPGDPMNDLIVRFRAELVARDLTLPDLLEEIGTQQALCQVERVHYIAGTREDEFCPSARSTSRADALDVYSFTAPGNDGLTVRAAADGSIASAELVNNGTVEFACSGAACSGIAIGMPNAEGKRSIAFDGTVLAAAGGGVAATLDGSLLADPFGMPSPQTLSCSGAGGFFHVLLSSSNTFPGTCVEAAGVTASGPAARSTYQFLNTGGDSIVVDGETLSLRVHADGPGTVSVILYSFGGAFDLERRAEFKCGGVGFAPCTGVVIDPSEEVGEGSISLDDTVLTRVGANGEPVSSATATVRAATLLAGARQVSFPPECEFIPEVANMAVSDGLPYAYCPDENNGDNSAGPFGEEIRYSANSNFGSGFLRVYTLPGSLEPIRVEASRESDGVELFVCDQPACLAGVTLTRDGDGRITIAFDNAALQERDLVNTAGDRSATLTDGAISFPAFE